MDEATATVGARLRELRELTGLSVGQVAKLAATTPDAVRAHEAGAAPVDDLALARYARLYNVTVAALRDGVATATVEDLALPPSERAKWDRLSEHDRREVLRVATYFMERKGAPGG